MRSYPGVYMINRQVSTHSTRSSTFQQADPRLSRDKPECGAAYFEREQTRLPHGLLLTGGFESTYRVRAERDLNELNLLAAALSSQLLLERC